MRRTNPDIRDKDVCHGLVTIAIREGRLVHPRGLPCADCDGVAVEYDHRDYSQPLKVEPVCRSCNLKRGPAIPRPGSIERIVRSGAMPYTRRFNTDQLLRVMNLPTDALRGMPKMLTHAHWLQLLPLFHAESGRKSLPSLTQTKGE